MHITKLVWLLSLLSYFTGNELIAQDSIARIKIKSHSDCHRLIELQDSYTKEYEKLLQLAKKLGFAKSIGSANDTSNLAFIADNTPYYYFETNLKAAQTIQVHNLWKGGSSSLNLSGNNIVIGQWEASTLPLISHRELIGKISYQEPGSPGKHGSHVAGTLVASGIDPAAKGMAPSATIHSRISDNDTAEMAQFALSGALLSNHSYGVKNTNNDLRLYGYYSKHAKRWDEIANAAPYYLMIKSAGNIRNEGLNPQSGGYDLLLGEATAKNNLVVGAVAPVIHYTGPQSVQESSFSSYGPTDDWRIKPDVVADGVDVYSTGALNDLHYLTLSGTSMATPTITGAIALLQEHYHNLTNNYMKSASVKAVLINTTEEVGAYPGPDYANGWGLVNVDKAAKLISDNQKYSLIIENVLSNNSIFEFTIQTEGNTPLKTTLAWTDVPAELSSLDANDPSSQKLVNDLDLRVIQGNQTYKPWFMRKGNFEAPAERGDNFRDNIEKIEIDTPISGTYTIRVTHKGMLNEQRAQEFSIALTGISSHSLSTQKILAEYIHVFPNPVTDGIIHIKHSKSNLDIQPRVFDLQGRFIQQLIPYNKKNTFTTAGLQPGIYFLHLMSSGRTQVEKIIITEK